MTPAGSHIRSAVVCGMAFVSYPVLGQELPITTVARSVPANPGGGEAVTLAQAFQITETDLVCDRHEVTLLLSQTAGQIGWVVADRVNVAAGRLFHFRGRAGVRALVVSRCGGKPSYAAYGPFRWQPSSDTRTLKTNAARTVRVRTDESIGEPLRFVLGDAGVDMARKACQRHRDVGWECIGISATAPALAVFETPSGPHWAVAVPQGKSVEVVRTQRAAWGRLVQLTGIDGTQLTSVRVGVLSEKQPGNRRRTVRPVVGTDQHSHSLALGPTLWWVVGGGPVRDRLLEARGHPIATQRLRLDEMVGELPSLAFQLSVFPGTILRGDVTGPNDRPASGTVLSVFEYDARSLGRETGDEPRTLHWVADVTTDQGGRFEVAGLARTRYEVVALHPSLGRQVVDWDVDGRILRIRLEGRPRLRGRVVSDGYPVTGLTVRVVPQREDFEMVEDPMAVVVPSQVTADDGRFAVAVPAEGEGHLLIGNAAGSRVRLAYPEASGLEEDVELGDIELPGPVELHVLTYPGCEVYSGGPVGELGTTIVTGEYDPPSGLYRLRVPEPGLWWVEANCAGRLDPAASRLVRVRAEDDSRVIRLVAEEPGGG